MNRLHSLWMACFFAATAAFGGEGKARPPGVAPTFGDVTYGAHEKELMNVWQVESDQPVGVLLATYGSDSSKLGYGPDWAECSNVPFRLYKMWAHEGGIASPLIAHWPKGISGKGEMVTQLSHVTDLMPTLLELAGASYQPEERKTFPDLVGQSLVPAFAGKAYERGPIFWEHKGNRALRKGKWKLVADGIHGAWELYDMEKDRTELNNLATKRPEIVDEMAKEWDEIAKATHVYPLDGRGWGAKIKDPLQKNAGKERPNKKPNG